MGRDCLTSSDGSRAVHRNSIQDALNREPPQWGTEFPSPVALRDGDEQVGQGDVNPEPCHQPVPALIAQHVLFRPLRGFVAVNWPVSRVHDFRGRGERLVRLAPAGTDLAWCTPVVVLVVEGRLQGFP